MGPSISFKSLLSAVAVAALGAAMIGEASAADRRGSARVETARSGATIDRSAVRQPGAAAVTRSTVTDRGRTFQTSRDRATTRTEDGVATTGARSGPFGGQQTYAGEATRTDDGFARQGLVTTQNGRGVSTAADVSRTGEGVAIYRSATTQGRSADQSVTYSYEHGEGVSRSGSTTTASGRSASRDGSAAYVGGEGVQRAWTTTNGAGQSASGSATLQAQPGGYVRETARTGPDGRTVGRTSDVTATGQGQATQTVTVTGPNGQQAQSGERYIQVYPQ